MQWKPRLAQSLMLISVNFLSGCALWEMIQSQNAPSTDASPPQPTPAASAPPPVAASPQPTLSPFTVFTAPPLQPTTTPIRENYSCLTANYFADILWQQDQPKMNFGRNQAQAVFRDAPSKVTSNADGSFTYEASGASLYYARVYPDRTCLIQVVDPASGTPTIEETGRLGGLVLAQTHFHIAGLNNDMSH